LDRDLFQIIRGLVPLELLRPVFISVLRRFFAIEAGYDRLCKALFHVHRMLGASLHRCFQRIDFALLQVRKQRPIAPHQCVGDGHQLSIHLARQLMDADRVV
jgi:hypothetical protein